MTRRRAARLDAEIAHALRGFNAYRDLPADPTRGNPLHAWGAVHASKLGSYWTIPVAVPLAELAALRPVVASKARLASVARARQDGVALPPIEVGVFPQGGAWIVDGNHRLVDARQARLAAVPVVFTFVGT